MEAQSKSALLYPTENWLDAVADIDYYTGERRVSLNTSPSLHTHFGYWYQSQPYWYNFVTPERVRLKLSEVERLRLAAAKDPVVKAALNKMAHLIEIEVDF